MRDRLLLAVTVVAVLFVLGFGFSARQPLPPNAQVYLDMDEKTFLAPACTEQPDELQISTVAEAQALNFEPDSDCEEESGFTDRGRSYSALLLVRLGLLAPQKGRWNADGSWNW